jgi:hypothetical protein
LSIEAMAIDNVVGDDGLVALAGAFITTSLL